MNATHTQLKALVLMLVLVVGITTFERVDSIARYLDNDQHTANIFNPVAAFLGIQTGQSTETTNQPAGGYTGSNDGDGLGGAASLLTTPVPVTGAGNTLVDSSQTTQSGAAGGSLANRTPTLICLPGVIDEGEEVLVMWACRDGAHTTSSDTIATDGKTIGSVRVRPGVDTTYTIVCENDIPDADNTSAECRVDVSNPALAIIATPSRAQQGGTVTLSWKTKDTNSCYVTSDSHSNFERRGIEGDALSPRLTRNTTFTLTCETITGVLEERSVTVGVN